MGLMGADPTVVYMDIDYVRSPAVRPLRASDVGNPGESLTVPIAKVSNFDYKYYFTNDTTIQRVDDRTDNGKWVWTQSTFNKHVFTRNLDTDGCPDRILTNADNSSGHMFLIKSGTPDSALDARLQNWWRL